MENKIAEALKGEKEILVNSLKGKKVAVIEDDEVQRDIYLQMIKQFIGDSKFSLESLTGYAKYPGRQNGTLYLGTSVGVWGLLDRWDQVPTQMILFNDTKFTPSVDLSKYSTIAIGGIGKMLAEPQTKGGLEEVLRFCARHDFDYTIVGNGSNTIFGDLEGMTIRTNGLDGIYSIGNSTNPQEINQPEKPLELGSDQVRSFLENQEPETELLIEFGAGHKTMPLARQAPNLGIAGVEFLIGIPGTIGGAAVMNAGTGAWEMKGIVKYVKTLDHNGKVKIYSNDDLDYDHRYSILQGGSEVVYAVGIRVMKGDPEKIQQRTDSLKVKREDQPNHPSVGSAWVRRGVNPESDSESDRGSGVFYTDEILPETGIAGWKSQSGNLCVPRTPDSRIGWLINPDRLATSYDVLELASRINRRVLEHYKAVGNIDLKLEVKLVGNTPSGHSLNDAFKQMKSGEVRLEDAKKHFGYESN